MTTEQTTQAASRAARRAAAFAVWLAMAIGGAAALAAPFLLAGPVWRWGLVGQVDLEGAAVNANLLRVDEQGVCLARQGERPISLISPPLALPDDSNRVLAIEAARPDTTSGQPVATTVRLLWQTEPAEQFHFEQQVFSLDDRLAEIRFSLPAPAAEIHRLGVQFPDTRDAVVIRSFALPDLPLGERVELGWQQVNAHEPLANHSINFIRGPQALGRGFNYYLLSLLISAVGVYGALAVVRRREVSRRGIAAIAILVWILADGQATRNLSRQARVEARELRGKTWPEQIAAMSGPEIAWAYQQMTALAPLGASYAVVSDDPFTPSRRLDYLLAPQRVRRESYQAAEFIVVIRASEAVFDERDGAFRWQGGAGTRAEKLAELSSGVYLLRRVQP